ncbi:MAG: glycosyltransferase family 4 protein [Verrucomicrobiota bacterium]
MQAERCPQEATAERLCARKRVAVVHDWLPLYGGAERVLEQMLSLFPQADLFTLMESLPPGERGFLHGKNPHTSLIQRLPFCAKVYRHYFALMPFAIEQFDLSSYDIVISSSYAFAKGVLTGPDQLHVCYCHSPIRYAWDLQHQYLARRGRVSSGIARLLLHYIRLWDTRTANGVDAFLANSRFIARRIRKTYGREAQVVFPPVDVENFTPCADKDDYYLAAARFVPYKRIDLLVQAFARMPHQRLIVVGDGPEFARIRSRATPNTTLVGHQSQACLRAYLERARGFVFAGEEDFGITLVEAQACGTPVIAFGRGGAREIVQDGKTGVLFPEQTEASILQAIQRFEACRFATETLRRNADRFSIPVFRRHFAEAVESAYAQFAASL